MNSPLKLFIFGDQTVDARQNFSDVLKHGKASSLLRKFHEDCCNSLRAEILNTSTIHPRCFPFFGSLAELLDVFRESKVTDPVWNGTLLCIAQLSSFLLHLEKHPREPFPGQDSVLLGLCTGLLPAAAVAASTHTAEFLKLAVDVVRLSLKLGIEASRRTEDIEYRRLDLERTWSVHVSGAKGFTIQQVLDAFNTEKALPVSKIAYISAESDAAITVSGPPSTLEALFRRDGALAGYKHIDLPIHCAYHAAHLRTIDPSKVLETETNFSNYKLNGSIRMFSTSTGRPYDCTNLNQLLGQVLIDIFAEPLLLNTTLAACCNHLQSLGTGNVELYPLGPTISTNHISQTIQSFGLKVQVHDDELSAPPLSQSCDPQDIAIVGMAGRFPSAENLEDFWKVFEDGLDLHKTAPKDRFDIDTHFDPSGTIPNSTLTPYGCFIDRPGVFDARFFNMSPREAAQTDPQQRMALLATYEALEMAGYVPNRTPATSTRRIGTFFGQSSDDWREGNAGQNIDTYYITGGIRAFGPGRLNYHFKWEGPSYSLDTACSSSLAAVQVACTSLLNKECDTAVAGGMNLLTTSDLFAGLSRGSFLSKTGSCKTFDNEADGYCRADVVGAVVLKRLEDAIADRDNIQAVIKSVATNHSADAISITHPHAGAQERLFRRVLGEACVSPYDVDYIEMHGTGTQAGDATEMRSVTSVFAPSGLGGRRDRELYVGSVKPNMGHGEAGAGVTSLIKALLMLRKSSIPPHVGIKGRLNTNFPDLRALNVHIPTTSIPFSAPAGKKRKIMINNFDAAGGNTSLLLEDPPVLLLQGIDPRPVHIIAVSGKTPTAYRGNLSRLAAYLQSNPEVLLGDLSYTTTARRMHYPYRSAIAASTYSELQKELQKLLENPKTQQQPKSKPPRVAFTFTGQGAHHLGMTKTLYESNDYFRTTLQQYDAICSTLELPSFLRLVDGSAVSLDALSPVQIQLGIIAVELALVSLWSSWGVQPDFMIGHSLGEYAALCVAGVLSVTDTLFLVGNRAKLMMETCTRDTHAMLAVSLPVEEARNTLLDLKSSCEVACVNTTQDTVFSGEINDIQTLENCLRAKKIRTKRLQVSYAFHSSQLDGLLEAFQDVTRRVRFCTPRIPIASPLSGSVVRGAGVIDAEYLVRHARDCVNYVAALEASRVNGDIDENTLWIEIGPNPVTLGMIKSSFAKPIVALSSPNSKEDNWVTITKSVAEAYSAGLDIAWSKFQGEYETAHRLLELPSYAFEEKNHWIQYRGDWLLTKGNKSSVVKQDETRPPGFSTTALQRIVSETVSENQVEVIFESDISEPKFKAAIMGHLVNGVGLCPSSIYADMAFTAAKYIHSLMNTDSEQLAMNVVDMKVFQPFIAQDNDTQVLRVSASKPKGSDIVDVRFSSTEGTETKEHATCTAVYGDYSSKWLSSWSRSTHLIQSRIAALHNPSHTNTTHRFLRGMVYKLFSNLVKYHPKYQGIEEVWIDSQNLEATANIRFQSTREDGNFTICPYWIDSIAHLSGFVLNGNDTLPEDCVYISHGWEEMKFIGKLSATKTYQSYVKMQPSEGKGVMAGDVYLLDEGKVVAVCTGLKFQELRRTILEHILPNPGKPGTITTTVKPRELNRPSRAPQALETVHIPTVERTTFPSIIETIASEVGIAQSEITEDSAFAELGVDSLLTITILDKLRRTTNIDLPTSLFHTYTTVGALKIFFDGENTKQITVVPQHSRSSSVESSDTDTFSLVGGTGSESVSSVSTPPAVDDTVEIFRRTIIEELGIGEEELTPNILLTDLGLDSLMSLSIVAALRSRTGQTLSSTFFQENQTFADIVKFLGGPISSPRNMETLSKKLSGHSLGNNQHRATSVLLQGSSTSAVSLFLLPDGSGSASSYINLPPLSSNIAVYALNSPFIHSPTEFTMPLKQVIPLYVAELRARRPHGPYVLGGWSIGGTFAYEVAAQLMSEGESVLRLLLIDAPCRTVVAPVSMESVDYLESIGVFEQLGSGGKKTIPDSVRKHFIGSINALGEYKPEPLKSEKEPKALAIWAKESVVASTPTTCVKRKSSDWLLDPKEEFGMGGWDQLLKDVRCVAIPGNHFTIMRKDKIQGLADILDGELKNLVMS